MANDAPVVLAHFGRPHSGKTYEMEKRANEAYRNKTRETIFVFNSGRDTDWKGYAEIELYSEKKTETLFFSYRSKEYKFEDSFMKLFQGKKVKARRVKKALTKSLLFTEMSEKGYQGLFFIVDDAVAVIGSRLTFAQDACFYCAKHVDVWLGVVFHDPNQFPVRAWGALTFAKFFVNNVEPPTEKAKKIPHFRKVMSAFKTLRKAPKYSFCSIDMNSGEASYTPFKAIKPKQVIKPKRK